MDLQIKTALMMARHLIRLATETSAEASRPGLSACVSGLYARESDFAICNGFRFPSTDFFRIWA